VNRLGSADLFALKLLRAAHLSPDGQHLIYTTSRTDTGEEKFEIWMTSLQNRETQRLPFPGNAISPCWSPDGRWIAFIGDARLRVAEFRSLLVSEPLTPEGYVPQGALSWSPDSRRLALSLLERRESVGPRRITHRRFRAEGLGYVDGLSQQIYTVDHRSAEIRCLTAAGACSQAEWSPCGRRILFFASDEPAKNAGFSCRLLTIDVDNGEITEVLGKRWSVASAHWLPGGEHILVAAARDSTLMLPALSLWVVNRAGGEAQLRTPGMVGTIGSFLIHDMPAWDLMGNMFTVLDRSTAFASVQIGGKVEIWRVALDGDVAMEAVATGERCCIVLGAHRASNSLLFAATDLRSPPEIYRTTFESSQEEQLTTFNQQVLARWPAITVDRFVFESADGAQIESWFIAPAQRNGPVPTVLFIHGGPYGATGYAFRYDFLLLASHGFGVVLANFRGSVGYGEPFTRAIMGDWGERAYPDHIGAIDAAIARGFADADRLGVWGHSHGGFATCWIVGHTNRFKAAVAEAAWTNLATLYYLSDVPDIFAQELGGRPHEIPDVYRARSPITYGHRSVTPTLLVHGEEDLRCPISEAEQFYRLLQDVGCTTELLRIPGCNHLGDSDGPLSARQAQNEALLGWFLRHL
jgi:dipeptidyl aminopeptidase/acylaminoacyl peptidase